jgi:ribosomal protein L3 glutamine methyltransferase
MKINDQNIKQVINDLHTIADYIRWGYSQFNQSPLVYGHGTDNPWDEISQLTMATLHLPYTIDQELLNSRLTLFEKQLIVDRIVKRIEQRIPIAYLTHQAWFAGLPYYVDQRVIIPRSPFAELIENRFSPWVQQENPRILDICTGSGCIAIACALAFPESHVDAIDISPEALEVAKINVERHHVSDRVTLIESDLFSKLGSNQYDLIVSNPPYVASSEYNELPAEYRFEPQLALEAGEDGLSIIKRIMKSAANYLTSNGVLIVEVGSAAVHLVDAYPKMPFIWLDFEHGGEGVFLLTKEQLLGEANES